MFAPEAATTGTGAAVVGGACVVTGELAAGGTVFVLTLSLLRFNAV
jgi:hypothetical protein